MSRYSEQVMLDSPRAYWRLDETTGTTAVDTVAGRNGTHTGTVSLNQTGALADGSSVSALYGGGKTSIPVATIAAGSAITVEFWAKKTDTLTMNSAIEAATSANQRMLNIHLQWSDGNIYWDCGTGTAAGDYDRINKGCDFNVLQWHHYAFVKDAVAGTMYIYVDGVQWHSGTGLTRQVGTAASAYIAGYAVTGVADVPVHAYLDEFAIYPTALSAARIAKHFQEGRTTYAGRTATVSYAYTGGNQRFTVPDRVQSIAVEMAGAGGGAGSGGRGGYGQRVNATLPTLAAGTALVIQVGGRGQDQVSAGSQTVGGWPNGGRGGTGGGNVNGASGGGASQVYLQSNGTTYVMSGGGGGAGSHSWNGGESGDGGDAGGSGGTLNGGGGAKGKDTQSGQGTGSSYVGLGGGGATTAAVGVGGNGAANGAPTTAPYPGIAGSGSTGGTGGANYSSYGGSGGGGGGGFYGGGGGGGGNTYGGGGGGGAGSGFVGGGATMTGNQIGWTTGNGYVTITFNLPLPYVPPMMV